ncbi:predicted protein [Naegleria gruberi]|uniref:fructose-bisphosphate aldolase n=1 Tax=Naegleria gruberi TaxID=5762 RepID=D2W141_NAEGR|nr:uncharacterized protein NAEGRDRAFT_56383 [Naegleria gruberi]EFC37297.1 predicted protein [Naegleria gruberi]|eukprot:XP_002670041.1 predicted protein [Naegleria gruberi strain NEG-M]
MAHIDICGKFGAELDKTVEMMVARGKGLLAADESTSTIGKRFEKIQLENIEANRQAYRELLFTAPKEYTQFISGVILYEETLFQSTLSGKAFAELLTESGVVPGIKLDLGVKELPGTDGETATQGLDDLEKRIQKYYARGARFAKWRAVYKVSDNGLPSQLCVAQNAETLARYAAICQQNGLVPIVEPEILVMEGSHNIETSLNVTKRVLASVFQALIQHNVNLNRIILKPNMVLPGNNSPTKAEDDKKIAEYTIDALTSTVPPAVRGIMFLSGGQSEQQAVETLNAINKVNAPKPWAISYSYGRALQDSTIRTWAGKKENVEAAQKAYLEQAKKCSLAAKGEL